MSRYEHRLRCAAFEVPTEMEGRLAAARGADRGGRSIARRGCRTHSRGARATTWDNGDWVEKDRSYLVGFISLEPPSQEVHVNLRGYPGRTKIPRCEDAEVTGGKARRTKAPCFSDANGSGLGGRTATVYTVNRDADQWHVLYAWQDQGSLYAVSEHVAKPLTYKKVDRDLDRMMRGLCASSREVGR